MCCRYLLDRDHLAQVLARLGLHLPADSTVRTRYNIPPGGPIEIVRVKPHTAAAPERERVTAHWGLIPAWAPARQGFGAMLANARSETVAEKPVFRSAWRRGQRCVIPASGFFEWEREGRERLPWWFRRADDLPFSFAGLWETWLDPVDGARVDSCTLLTTTPNELVARIHDRMPVMLDDAATEAWLNPATAEPARLLQPFPGERLAATPLIPRVNRVAHDDPACLTPQDPRATAPRVTQLGLGL